MIKVSVIIPVYNAEQHLEECLASVLRQDIHDVEVICVNDGSADGSLDILRRFDKQDSRVRVVDQKNAGPSTSRNVALKMAGGEYIAFMDSDDLYPHDSSLSILYSEAIRCHALLCRGRIRYFNQNGKDWDAAYPPFFGFQSCLYSRHLFADGTLRFPNYRVFEDPPFLVAAMSRAGEVARIDDIVYWYRVAQRPPVDWAGAAAEKAKDALRGMIDTVRIARTAGLDTILKAMDEFCRGVEFQAVSGRLSRLDAEALRLVCQLDVELGGPLLPVLGEIQRVAYECATTASCLRYLAILARREIGSRIPDCLKIWKRCVRGGGA